MGLIVQKYGGTSMAGAERIRNVARRVVDTQKRGHDVVVVVSAMAGVTDQLVAMANEISPSPDPREYDMLVSTGEQQTIALLAMAIQALGVRSRSFTSAQAKVYTDDDHARARIHRIDTEPCSERFDAGAACRELVEHAEAGKGFGLRAADHQRQTRQDGEMLRIAPIPARAALDIRVVGDRVFKSRLY